MHTDPISDLLTRIRNAQMASHNSVSAPYSKMKHEVLKVMKSKNFISDFTVDTKGKHKELKISFNDEHPRLNLTRVSKPGQRIYTSHENLSYIKSGLGITILSTSKGIMSNIEAKKEKVGGEVLCEIH